MSDNPNRKTVLASMPEEERLQALGDEMLYGRFYAERTDDGWRRIEPEDTPP